MLRAMRDRRGLVAPRADLHESRDIGKKMGTSLRTLHNHRSVRAAEAESDDGGTFKALNAFPRDTHEYLLAVQEPIRNLVVQVLSFDGT